MILSTERKYILTGLILDSQTKLPWFFVRVKLMRLYNQQLVYCYLFFVPCPVPSDGPNITFLVLLANTLDTLLKAKAQINLVGRTQRCTCSSSRPRKPHLK